MTMQGLNSHEAITGLNKYLMIPFPGAQALQVASVTTGLLLTSWYPPEDTGI